MDTHYNRLTEAALTYTHILCFGRKNHILHPKIAIFKMIKVCSILHKHANPMKIHGENEFYIKRCLIYHIHVCILNALPLRLNENLSQLYVSTSNMVLMEIAIGRCSYEARYFYL